MLSKATIKLIKSLKYKKERDELKLFMAETPKVVVDILQQPHIKPMGIWVLENAADEVAPYVTDKSVIHIITETELNQLSNLQTPQKMVAVFHQFNVNVGDLPDKLLAFEHINDPGNFGTIIRTAHWFNFSTIICSEGSVDVFNPKVVQSSMGSVAFVKVLYENLETFSANKLQPYKKIATTLNGQSSNNFNFETPYVVYFGNEANGLTEPIIQLCNANITIPGAQTKESLNVATAAGIIMYQSYTGQI